MELSKEIHFKEIIAAISWKLAVDPQPKHSQLGFEIQRVLASSDNGCMIATECKAMKAYAEARWTLGAWWKASGFEEQRDFFVTWVQATAFGWERPLPN